MKNFLFLGVSYFFTSVLAHAADQRIGVALVCHGERNVAHLKFKLIRMINLTTQKETVQVEANIKGKWGGVEEQQLKLSQTWETILTARPTLYFSRGDAASNNTISFKSLGAALKESDTNIPGVILDVKLKTSERDFPYLQLKGVMGQLKSDTNRNLNVSLFMHDGEKSVKLGNDDIPCVFVVR